MNFIDYIKKMFLTSVFTLSLSAICFAYVPVDYPGWDILGEDRNLPGSPSTDMDDYKSELVWWGEYFEIPITKEMVNEVITKKMDAGFSSNLTFSYTDEKENIHTGIYYDINQPIWHMMRDIVFLETLQRSIKHWEKHYINPLGEGGSVSLKDAYNRAAKIQEEVVTYINDGFFSSNHNPIVSAIIGSGSTSYFNFFTADGVLEGYIEGKIVEAFQIGGSYVLDDGEFDDNFSFKLNLLGYTELATDLFINYYENSGGEEGIVIMMKTASTGGFAIASGGLSVVLAPGKIVYEILSWIGTTFLDSSRGAHLVNHYYLSKNYANNFKNYVLNSNGIIEFPNVKIFPGQAGGAVADDPIVNALANKNYSYNNSATDNQIQAVYTLSLHKKT